MAIKQRSKFRSMKQEIDALVGDLNFSFEQCDKTLLRLQQEMDEIRELLTRLQGTVTSLDLRVCAIESPQPAPTMPPLDNRQKTNEQIFQELVKEANKELAKSKSRVTWQIRKTLT